MAGIGILFNKRGFRTQFGFQGDNKELFGVIQLDATLRENHSFKSKVTTNEVEQDVDGTNSVNDNVVHQPETVQIEGIISEAPISMQNILKNVAVGAVSNISTVAGVAGAILSTDMLSTDSQDRVNDSLEQLLVMRDLKIPMTLVTGLRKYEDMLITSITIPVDQKIGKSIKFTIDFLKVKIVKSQTTKISKRKLAKDVQHTGVSKTNLGKQGTDTPSSEESSKGQSILSKLTGIGI